MIPLRLAAVILFVPSLAVAADLDAPIAKETITIRSEIERGINVAPDPAWTPIRNYSEAVQAISTANQKITGCHAFQFGLYYSAWHRLWACLRRGVYKSEAQQDQAISDANYFYALAVAFQKELGLTDADVRQVCGALYVDGEDKTWPELVRTGHFHEFRRKRNLNPATPPDR